MELIKQGFFKEMSYGDQDGESIIGYLNKEKDENIEKICSYLDAGKVIFVCCGTSVDVINPDKGIAGVPSIMTDGKWVWAGDLSYYVKNYKLKLSDCFLEDMKKNDWIPKVSQLFIDEGNISFV